MTRVAPLFLLLASCAVYRDPPGQREEFMVEGGDVLTCRTYVQERCGMHLTGCGDDEDANFNCVTSILYLGPASLE